MVVHYSAIWSIIYAERVLLIQAHGLLFMLMFSGHTVGRPTFVVQNYGFFFLLINVTLCLTACIGCKCHFARLKTHLRYMTYSVYNIFGDVSESMFPGFKKTVWLECTQMKNEIIFVPSGWYHQVHNLEDVISINHNWFNAYNLDWVWNLLVGDYNVAKELIEDIRDICDDFESLCQRNLAANTGMNFVDFFTFITRMSFANIIQLCNITEGSKTVSKTTSPWAQHIVLNLLKARKVALKMNSTILAEDSATSLDIRKSLDDPAFLELYRAMNSTYKKLHEPSTLNLEDNKAWKNDIHDSVDMVGFQVSNSKNLINLIDCILKGLGNSDLLVDEFLEET